MTKNYTSKTYQFDNFPEAKNATEEEQEAFHSKPYSFNIPNNIDDFNNSNIEKNVNISKSNSVYKDIQNDYKNETAVQQTKKHHLNIDDDDDVLYDNLNSLSEKQDNSKISNGKVSKKIKTS
ncbi:kinase-like domain-containing protein [Rhizophagus irregularis DAOM 181602=DAOM 197198]|nr:kinase-like domain-containing protein [Rhizophagus irregularis DAOM 181602=DAOM 197198]